MNAETYMQHWKKNNVSSHLMWEKHQIRLKRIASFCTGSAAIDVGCAYGHSTQQLQKFYPAEWTGLDFAKDAIDVASSNTEFKNIKWVLAKDYNLIGLLGRKFDTVVCSEVIEHVEIDNAFVHALWDITGSTLIVTTPNRRVDDPGHLRVYTREMLDVTFEGIPHEVYSETRFFYIVCHRDKHGKNETA